MDSFLDLLKLIQSGQRSFMPCSDREEDMKEFQSVAKMIVYAKEENLLDSCSIHRESRTGNKWYDSVLVNGLSFRGEQFLSSAQASAESTTSFTDALILQPNFAGIGIDLKVVAKYLKQIFRQNA